MRNVSVHIDLKILLTSEQEAFINHDKAMDDINLMLSKMRASVIRFERDGAACVCGIIAKLE